jgi:malonyl-CoA/methylmalonyl-CoA synthetase
LHLESESNVLILGAAVAMWARNLLSRTLARHKTAAFAQCSRSTAAVRMASTLPRLPIFEAIKKHDAQRTAVVHSPSGRSFTYGELVNDVAAAKDKLQRNTGGQSAEGARISFLVENGYDYVGAHPIVPVQVRHCRRDNH